MNDFQYYLDEIGEVGYVSEVLGWVLRLEGLPGAKINEVVVFEDGSLGQIMGLNEDFVDVLSFDVGTVKVGSSVARTNEILVISVGQDLLGKTVSPLVKLIDGEKRSIDPQLPNLFERLEVNSPLETGVSLVDLTIPLGKGQRELVIGDRKIGKTQFLFQTMLMQAKRGVICVYAAIAKRQADLVQIQKFVANNKITEKVVIVASNAASSAGEVFLTPYSAMTIAEYFRDQGKETFVVFDDMTVHAKYYREITLLLGRFPGRNTYPGDIFYVHSRLLERAGNFKKAPISCLAVAETAQGDISGYIQTNLMSMTDGHIFFDIELFNKGKRPAINPFLSVTRVGHQTQNALNRDLSRELTSLLVRIDKVGRYLHFGAELGEDTKRLIELGDRINRFFEVSYDLTVPVNVSSFVLALIWAGQEKSADSQELKQKVKDFVREYSADLPKRKLIDEAVLSSKSLAELVTKIKQDDALSNIF